MKAKYSIGLLSILLLASSAVKAQNGDSRDFRNDDARIVVNNYYDDNDDFIFVVYISIVQDNNI